MATDRHSCKIQDQVTVLGNIILLVTMNLVKILVNGKCVRIMSSFKTCAVSV